MRVLLRYITRRSQAGVDHKDKAVETDNLTIGRGTDADLFLTDLHVALHHAVLRRVSSGRFAVQARTPSGVKINGETTQSGIVRPGDSVGVGLSTLRLEKGGEHDLVIEVDEARTRSGGKADAGATTLRAAGLRRRRWAWALFLLVLGIGLGLPMGQIYLQRDEMDGGQPTAGVEPDEDASVPNVAMDWLLSGGDRVWSTGPMSKPHQSFGEDCGQCHRKPFQRVTDAACVDCHESQPHHADDEQLMRTAGLSERRCASCHVEHSGTEALRASDSALCSDCHAEPQRNMPGSDLQAVAGFAEQEHPQFRVRLVSFDDEDRPTWDRVRMTGPVSENSGLLFPHDVHLDEEGIQGPEGKEQLACADCHQPGPTGTTMQPVRFEQDCQSCHQLDFEPEEPDRQLPHGKPELVLSMLEEYYSRVALAGGFDRSDAEVEPPEVVKRDRPASSGLDEGGRRAALAWAQEQARVVAGELFEYRTCHTCHNVERVNGAEAEWRVHPVALTQHWFPRADFTHAKHEQMACNDCHAAGESDSSEDVLMPAIGNCQECHGGADASAKIASDCTDCHGFHTASELEMGTGNGGLVNAAQ